MEAYLTHQVGARMLEALLRKEGLKLSHNRIHRLLMEEGLAGREARKQRKRKWVKYERSHSMTLWHADWFLLDEAWRSLNLKGRRLLLVEDDASRLITGYALHESPTAEHRER